MPQWLLLLPSLLLWSAGPPAPAGAQGLFSGDEAIPDPVAEFEARIEPARARPGEHVRVLVTARIAKGWYMYSVTPQADPLAPPPTKLEFQPGTLVPAGPVYETNPTRKVDSVFNLPLAFHPRGARFYQNLQVPADTAGGRVQVDGSIRFQTCNDRLCLPPRNEPLSAALTVEEGPLRPPYAYMQRTIDYVDRAGVVHEDPDTLAGALAGGLGAFLALAVGFGLLALLTPCVFPMIPVTVSFFAGAAREGHAAALRLALLFGAGIVVTYTGLGLVLTFLLGAAGVSQFATSPWINILVALFFTAFALSLMGLFETALPSPWVNWLEGKSRSLKGTAGVLVMGVAFTATSFTCTMPFVGTLLVAATQGELLWPLVGMLVFSIVFALPFVLLALFPGWVAHLRGRSGNWLVQVKVALGLLELMAALKFVSNADLIWQWGVFDRLVVLGSWAALSVVAALMLAGALPWPGVRVAGMRPARIAAVAAFALMGAYFTYGLSGRELNAYTESYLPPPLSGSAAAAAMTSRGFVDEAALKGLPWLTSLDEGLARARVSGKPVFIDFTGYTCVNCRWMEKKIFAEQNVYEAFRDQFELVQLYTDGGDDAERNQRLQIERFRTIALPYYVVLSPDNAVLATQSGIVPTPGEFLRWLQGARRQFAPASGA
ncbi:MAG: thioredoxin family protein [Candidatus Lambdaproteobacteria bacterium]|nr:thioredoxin family protein [Candidatus Lambdaproteobacteria bacterium]